jgi:hypothetical protein
VRQEVAVRRAARTTYATVMLGALAIGVGVAGQASAAPGAPSPKVQPVVTAQDRFFSIFCPILFVALVAGGGFIALRRRKARKLRSAVLPMPAGAGLSMSSATRDYETELDEQRVEEAQEREEEEAYDPEPDLVTESEQPAEPPDPTP